MQLKDKIALVTGASRGIGRGIAVQLGGAGATVYVTGRKKPQVDDDLPTLEDTAREITKRGGQGIAVYCDHSNPDDTKRLFEQIEREHNGKLDILVNNAYSAVDYLITNPQKKFWELEPWAWDEINNVGLRNHYICSVYAARLMTKQKSGLIVNVSSAGGLRYFFNVAYGVGKEALDRMSVDCAQELKEYNVACISLWPGAVRTELVLKYTVQEVEDSVLKNMRKMCEQGETTEYSGKCVVHLAEDVNLMQKSGRIWITSDLGDFYGFNDIDGKRPKNLRSLKTIMEWGNWTKTASWTPEWVKVPGWLLGLAGTKL